jgi:PhnB protein
MTMINPYLTFNGNCEEAFNFYRSVFGGEFLRIVRFKDDPSEQPMPEGQREKIMHIALPIGQETVLMASDRPDVFGPVTIGSNFSISIHTESEEETDNLFKGLSAGGQVAMSLHKTFWNAYFGMLTDKFGIQWMVSYDYPLQQ